MLSHSQDLSFRSQDGRQENAVAEESIASHRIYRIESHIMISTTAYIREQLLAWLAA